MSAVLPAESARRREHVFFTVMALLMALIVFAGFARTFYLRAWFPEARALAPPEPVFYVHGVLFTRWPVLLAAQAPLVNRGRTALHRRLGVVGAPVAAALVVSGLYVSLVAANRPGGFIGVPAPPLEFLIVPVSVITIFGLLVGLALYWRRDIQTHKRLMLLGTAGMLDAAAARLPLPMLGPEGPPLGCMPPGLFALAPMGRDPATRGRLHGASLWGGLLIIFALPLRMAVADSPAWLALAGWLTGLFARRGCTRPLRPAARGASASRRPPPRSRPRCPRRRLRLHWCV